jgi:hypothetical protein
MLFLPVSYAIPYCKFETGCRTQQALHDESLE